jgi:hypothetical protein
VADQQRHLFPGLQSKLEIKVLPDSKMTEIRSDEVRQFQRTQRRRRSSTVKRREAANDKLFIQVCTPPSSHTTTATVRRIVGHGLFEDTLQERLGHVGASTIYFFVTAMAENGDWEAVWWAHRKTPPSPSPSPPLPFEDNNQ